LSIGYSHTANLVQSDPRSSLDERSNLIEDYQGVSCFLWKTMIHPFNRGRFDLGTWFESLLFEFYRKALPREMRGWIKLSQIIIVESGLGVLFLEMIKAENPRAKLIYHASDDLETIKASPFLKDRFQRDARMADLAVIRSRCLAPALPSGMPTYFFPPCVDPEIKQYGEISPFQGGINAVSVGSMLFDTGFFEIATQWFPNIKFHVIGSGVPKSKLPVGVIHYDEIPFEQTIGYIRHADFGIAPYRSDKAPAYLADTSLKLLQFAYFGVPAVCPHFAVGDATACRFGYEIDDPATIKSAIQCALAKGRGPAGNVPSWDEHVQSMLKQIGLD